MKFLRTKNVLRKPRAVIHIYTEGQETEPRYFEAIKKELRLHTIRINVMGCGMSTTSLVDRAILDREKEKKQEIDEDYSDEWWAVFDRDSHPDFDQAIAHAKKNDIHVAYSNEAFELWFLLHFDFIDAGLDRDMLNKKLAKKLGKKYEKSMQIYPEIKALEADAIRNAKRCESIHKNHLSHGKRNPCTTVYKLVERLRKFAQ